MVHTRSREVSTGDSNARRDTSSSREKLRYTDTKDDIKRGSKVGVTASETHSRSRRLEHTERAGATFEGTERKSSRCLRQPEAQSFSARANTNGYVEHATRSSSLRRRQPDADRKRVNARHTDIADDNEDDDIEEEQPLPSRRLRTPAATSSSLMEPFSERLRQRKGSKHDEAAASADHSASADHNDSTPVKQQEDLDDEMDMYTRVKRVRRQVKRDMYGMPLREDEGKSSEEDDVVGSSDDEQEEEGQAEEAEDDDNANEEGPRSYFLRQHKPRTQLFEAAPIEPRRKERGSFKGAPSRKKYSGYKTFMSPARRMRRKRTAFHGSSSTSSSSSDDGSGDERRFERRKAKSMAKSRQRCLPMNFASDDIVGIVKDRQRIGSSLADIDPMYIDRSVTFDSIGGLGEHLQALKEMVVFPLLYPEVFEKFKISPPRGVLFYGPPGTGKTLVARALANECSRGEKRVAFFMRKGADCLSKWVGESERQLRLLFDQAFQMRPSIIFFDEIDGLAPVRSSRQDQIHSSIVSTLLALMDGLDSRGEVVVIGATNRIDSIDPALRRPGRFDRELLFSLPSAEARKQILKIHTKDWNPKLLDSFVEKVAEKCVGYCGADLKALCTEAALHALRRRYPQIYASEEKLQLDVSSIVTSASDFERAMRRIVPAGRRSADYPGRALSATVRPLLAKQFTVSLLALQEIFSIPLDRGSSSNVDLFDSDGEGGSEELAVCSSSSRCLAGMEPTGFGAVTAAAPAPAASGRTAFSSAGQQHPATHRPRLLLSGYAGQGQTVHLAPALLHHYENVRMHVLDVPALYTSMVRSPEESCTNIFREARRYAPSIIYMPRIDSWWDVAGDTLRAALLSLVEDIEPFAAVLLLATTEEPHSALPDEVKRLFHGSDISSSHHVHAGQIICMRNPIADERKEFFKDLLLRDTVLPPPRTRKTDRVHLEVLPKAPPPEPRRLTDNEIRKLRQHEEATLRELRLFLRDVLNKLARDRKFQIFAKRVDENEVPDYYEIITKPMDLGTIMSKIDLHHYQTVAEFLADIELICSNALYYNPDTDIAGRAIRHRACALRDTANALVANQLDPEFEADCKEIAEARQKRGELATASAPDYYYTRALAPDGSSTSVNLKAAAADAGDYPTRYSRRLRGMGTSDPDASGMPSGSSSALDGPSGDTEYQSHTASQWHPREKSSASLDASSPISDAQGAPHHGRSRLQATHRQREDNIASPTAGRMEVSAEAMSCQGPQLCDMDVTDTSSVMLDDSAELHEHQASDVCAHPAVPPAGDSAAVTSAAPLCNGHSEMHDVPLSEAIVEKPMPCLPLSEADSMHHQDELPASLGVSCHAAAMGSRTAASCSADNGSIDVNISHLSAILDDLVERTHGFDVSRLEHIYACLSRKVCQYRNSSSRSHLTAELEQLVQLLTA